MRRKQAGCMKTTMPQKTSGSRSLCQCSFMLPCLTPCKNKWEENRRRGRILEKGSRYVLQGLLVCAKCGYASCGDASELRGQELPWWCWTLLPVDGYVVSQMNGLQQKRGDWLSEMAVSPYFIGAGRDIREGEKPYWAEMVYRQSVKFAAGNGSTLLGHQALLQHNSIQRR